MVVLFTGGISWVRGDVGFLYFKIGVRETKKKRRLSRKTKRSLCGNQGFSRITFLPRGDFRRISEHLGRPYCYIQESSIQNCPTLGGLGKAKRVD